MFKKLQNSTFHHWHDLRKSMHTMKVKLTYKEFTLMAGIAVALIIVLTLWLRPTSSETGDTSRKIIPPVTKPAAKAVIEKVLNSIQDSL